jgi:hypothetical protein
MKVIWGKIAKMALRKFLRAFGDFNHFLKIPKISDQIFF